jgi:hypothetical protein
VAQDQAQDGFDWVSAQAQCTPATMFERLRTEVRDDVQRRNDLPGRTDGWRFECETEEDDTFEVARVSGSLVDPTTSAVVTFERAGRRIHIHSEDIDIDFTAIVMLDVSGACRFVVGEAIYSDWEIRRMSLGLLFFEESEEEE